ncbi:MucBP domain-containing protein [Carnobacterium divergens]
MNTSTSAILNSGTRIDAGARGDSTIVAQYVKENEIVAYRFIGKTKTGVSSTTEYYQPVRVHGYIINKEAGKIKYDVSYFNNSNRSHYYALTYGAHLDVGGAHTRSKLYSYGENGLYFDEPDKTPVDQLPARIYFYMNKNYPDMNGPTSYKAGNLADGTSATSKSMYKIGYWSGISIQEWLNPIAGYLNPYENWNPVRPKGYKLPLNHPVFALRWEPVHVAPNEVGTGSLDLAITEDEGTGVPPDPEPEINIKVKEEVFHIDGIKAETAIQGEKLLYRTTVSSEGAKKNYNFVAFLSFVDPNLENITDIVIKNKAGDILGSGGYNEAKNQILTNSLKTINNKEELYFEYSATVKKDAKVDNLVKEKISFQGSYEGGTSISPINSNEVETKVVKPKEIIERVLNKAGEVAENAKAGESLHYITTLKGENTEIKNVVDKTIVANPKSEMSTVTINYLDENNKEIQESKVIRGEVGSNIRDEYLKIPIIPGYDFESSFTWDSSNNIGFPGVPGKFMPGDQRVNNKYTKMTGPIKYKKLTFKQPLDTNLENPTNVTLKTKEGSVIGEGRFNATDKVVEANLNQEVLSTEDILFEFDATVKTDVTPGVLVKGQTTVEGVYNTNAIFYKALSNEVSTMIIEDAGKLIFVSAPQLLDYGDNLKILTKDQKYSTQVKEDALVVQDSRGSGSEWSMRATLLESLSSDSNHELKDALHYYSNGQDYTFSVGDAIPIMDKKTTDSQPIDISSNWKGVEEGPVLDVKAGKPYAEKYSTSIQWTLQDVPGNG